MTSLDIYPQSDKVLSFACIQLLNQYLCALGK